MSDNTILNPGVNGDVARSIDRAGVKTQVVAIDLGGQAGPENLLGEGGMPITAETLPLPTGAATQATLAALNVIAQAISDAVASAQRRAPTPSAAHKPPAATGATCNEPGPDHRARA
jgi:hypothetical protein